MTLFEYSAGAFIYRRAGGRVLYLVLEKDNGEHDLAKGHIEKGESAAEAARREIREETGLEVEFDPFFSETTRYFFQNRGRRIAKQVKFFLAETGNKNVCVSGEHRSYTWADYDSAVALLKFKDLVSIMPKVREYISRLELMKALNSDYSKLPGRSSGWSLSTRLVPGEGRLDSEVMLIGQAPGANEDRQLRPFVGRSGMLLDSVLRKARIRRREVYITSVVQFFPPDNRMPNEEEIEACMPFLKRQIGIIRPKYVVLLGNLASESLIGSGEVERNHGTETEKDGIRYMVTFHPAAALRFGEKKRIMESDFIGFAKKMKG